MEERRNMIKTILVALVLLPLLVVLGVAMILGEKMSIDIALGVYFVLESLIWIVAFLIMLLLMGSDG